MISEYKSQYFNVFGNTYSIFNNVLNIILIRLIIKPHRNTEIENHEFS